MYCTVGPGPRRAPGFVLGRLGNLSEGDKDDWAACINDFQDEGSGLYLAQSFEPHHSASPPWLLGSHDHARGRACAPPSPPASAARDTTVRLPHCAHRASSELCWG